MSNLLAIWWWPLLMAAGLLLALFVTYETRQRHRVKRTERRWVDAWHGDIRKAAGGVYQLSHGYRTYTSPYGTEQRIVDHAQMTSLEQGPDEAVLLGPVSAWVAEGEAQAVRDWEAKHPTPPQPWKPREPRLPDCDNCEWVDDTVLGDTARSYIRGYPCAAHRLEPPADITGIKMTKIR